VSHGITGGSGYLAAMLPLLLLACTPRNEGEPQPGDPVQTLDLARALHDEVASRWDPEALALGWIETVLAFGNLRLHAATGDPAHLAHPRAWVADHLAVAADREIRGSDALSPSSIASMVAAADPEFDPTPYVTAADAYLAEVPRVAEGGGVVHWHGSALFEDDQVWVDSQFMVGMYWLAEHDRTGDAAPLAAAAAEYVAVSSLCRDAESALYRHAYDLSEDANIPPEPVFWARGNSWSLVFGAEVLARLPDGDPLRAEVAQLVAAHAEALLEAQDDDGLWRTVLTGHDDDPANYTETSGSALIGFGLLRAAPVLEAVEVDGALRAAVDGILARVVVDADGAHHVVGTSFGTNPGDYAYYVSVPQIDDQALGYGAVLAFLAEVDGWE
jgi:unsaturated rhamnogalacturonyl hydrolase